MRNARGQLIDFIGPNPNFVDNNRDLGLDFSIRTQIAAMLMKINVLFYGKPPCD